MTNPPDTSVTERVVHISHLQGMLDRMPRYEGDAPKALHYQRNVAALEAAIASLIRKNGSEGVERLLTALEPFEQDWRDMGMPASVSDDKLMLDCDPQGEILTVGDYRRLFAAIAALKEGDSHEG